MSYCDILVKGKNLAYLFERLKKNSVDVLKVKKIDENAIILRVSRKDYQKVFAILNKTWYNKLIRRGGFFGAIQKCKKRVFFFASMLAFVLATQLLKNTIFNVEIVGLKNNDKNLLLNNLQSYGVEKYCNYNLLNVDEIKKNILTDFDSLSFVTIEKSGNRLIINCFKRPKNDFINELNQSVLISNFCGKLIRLNVFSGTQMKNVGDIVNVGDTLIIGKVFTENGEYPTQALGYAVIQSEFVFEKSFENFSSIDKLAMINEAKFFTPCKSEENIVSYSLQETNFGNGVIISVKVNYLVEVGG